MSILSRLVRTALPVGSARRDWLTQRARTAGVLGPAVPSHYERWQHSIEPMASEGLHPLEQLDSRPDSGLDSGPVRLAGSTFGRVFITLQGGEQTTAGVAGITRTLVSLANQTYSHWVAVVPDSVLAVASQSERRTLDAAFEAEPRLARPGATLHPQPDDLLLDCGIGDVLAARACEWAAALLQNDALDAVVGEHDMIDPISGRRSAPAGIGGLEPDLMDQFDLASGFLVSKRSVARNELVVSRMAFVPEVLMHRLVGVRQRHGALLEPQLQPPSLAISHTTFSPSPIRFGGSRIQHVVPEGIQATLVVRQPLANERLAAKQLDYLKETAGNWVQVVHVDSWKRGLLPAPTPSSDVIVVIDGGLTPSGVGWLDELVGVLLQPHVFAVSPVVVVPSGIAADAGVVRSPDGLRARSGRVDLAPFELARCRQTASLSGRVMVLRAADGPFLFDLDHRSGDLSSSIEAHAERSGRRCVVWGHQQWRLDIGLHDAAPSDSPMLAWGRGRLRSWFDESVEPHQPEPGRIGEGVW